jgi:(1->4)-alpha-D-glucan 1-alpha-D-glucosylmutase
MLTATYRLQVNKDFPLARVREIVPYLRDLGISHLYLSPVLAARPGSTHGYDVVDPTRVNPEVGTEDELRALAAEVHAAGMGIVLDIVPNHMGIGPANPYWEDILRHGRQSRYAKWYDIDWDSHPKRRGKVVLPVLGDELEAVLEKGELGLDISESGGVRLKYYDNTFPLDPATVPPELQLVHFDPNAKPAAEDWVHGEDGRARLRALVDAQHYTLAFWRCAPSDVNYRRFFDVNDLAAVRTEDADVFAETHAKILEWVRDGVIDGLRIDHVDGLRDPLGYLRRLREEVQGPGSAVQGPGSTVQGPGSTVPRTSSDLPIFVEKILSPGEHLRREWPVQGTTGYETLNDIESIFIHYDGACAVERIYRRMRRIGDDVTFAGIAREGRLKVLKGALRADIRRLARLLVPILKERAESRVESAEWRATRASPPRSALSTPHSLSPDSLTERALVDGLTQLLASLPVYRTYIDGRERLPHPDDRAILQRAVAQAEAQCNEIEHAVVQQIARVFLEPLDADDPTRDRRLEFTARFQQTTGPTTAKGVEDTALYVYAPLASRNEVGGEPDRKLHDAVRRFHAANAERRRDWPLALVATNTHDTKRSADLRARIDVLSEDPQGWERHLARWRRLNKQHKTPVKGRPTPDANTEYLLYQTLVGLWPIPPVDQRADDLPADDWFTRIAERLEQYMMKAVKEAKTHTSWTDPDPDYEEAVKRFVYAILEPNTDSPFLADVARFVSRVGRAGAWNSLARVLVHYTVPGTPDTYQGDELWNYALVDPDNRRPVDYEERRRLLAEVGGPGFEVPHPEDSRTKLLLVRQALHARRAMPELFREGDYVPLEARGDHADRVFAFARRRGGQAAITIVPRLTMALGDGRTAPVGDVWGDTRVVLPSDLPPMQWRSAVGGREPQVDQDGGPAAFRLSTLFAELPLALVTGTASR